MMIFLPDNEPEGLPLPWLSLATSSLVPQVGLVTNKDDDYVLVSVAWSSSSQRDSRRQSPCLKLDADSRLGVLAELVPPEPGEYLRLPDGRVANQHHLEDSLSSGSHCRSLRHWPLKSKLLYLLTRKTSNE
ncbi:hypothetical protein SAY86_025997 [Trapa natans]|uniref:Uncharacterized protein n=1 Tax=Trapa natans TaxID=22666 RepID=A0AAN7KF15_TRANT|nr:hypothetical protein SAY86_025997 [Trapa natans]